MKYKNQDQSPRDIRYSETQEAQRHETAIQNRLTNNAGLPTPTAVAASTPHPDNAVNNGTGETNMIVPDAKIAYVG